MWWYSLSGVPAVFDTVIDDTSDELDGPEVGESTTNPAASLGVVAVAGLALAVHLVASLAHGGVHVGAPVAQSAAMTGIVVVVVYVLPVIGFLLLWGRRRPTGARVFTAAMALSLGLGIALHFLVPGPDNVASVSGGARGPFLASAVGVALADGFGTAVGLWLWRRTAGTGGDGIPSSGRIDGVPDAGFRPLARLAYWFSRRTLGEVTEPLAVSAHNRGVLLGYSGFELALDRADRLDEELEELAVLKAAAVVGCEFCTDIGSALGREAGVTDDQLRDLATFEDSDAFTERERLAIRYAARMSETPADVPEELFDALREHLDEGQLVELTAAVAFENYRGRFNRAMAIESQGFSEGGACAVPEPPAGG